MRIVAILVATVSALLAITVWAPRAAYQQVSIHGPGFTKTQVTPAVYFDSPVGGKIPGKGEPGFDSPANKQLLSPEKQVAEPTTAYRYICYLGHRRMPVENPWADKSVYHIDKVGPVEVDIDGWRLLLDYALVVCAGAGLLWATSFRGREPHLPPRPSPWPEDPTPVGEPTPPVPTN